MTRPFKDGEFCVECGTNERPYHGRGLCVNCYARYARRQNPEKYREIDRKHQRSEKRKNWRKKHESSPEYKEYMLKKAAEYRARNTELCYERTRIWRANSREHLDAYNKARKDVKIVKKYGDDALRLMLECERKCQHCGSKKRVAVHHIDWDDKNNVYENFAILCGSCHGSLHSWVPPRYRREVFEEWMKTPLNKEIHTITCA